MHVSQQPIAIKHRALYGAVSMITGAQIRAARALLGITTQQLSETSGIHYATISRAEQTDSTPPIRAITLAAIQSALEAQGILFLADADTRDGGPGVRMRR